jgi:small subunit ribosomal protein S24e
MDLSKNKLRGFIMEIEFIEEKENKVFNRKEITFYVDYDGEATPKILDIKSKLVALLNTKKELLVVDNVQPHYGEPKALGYAKVYGTVDDLTYIETNHVLAKNEEVAEAADETEEAEEEASEEVAEEEAEE